MSVFSLEYRKDNPVTLEVLDDICASLGVTLKDEEKADYHRLLAAYHESIEKLMAMDDYVPPVDLERFPRKNVHLVAGEDNPLGAWAWKCDIQDENYKAGSGGLLEGKTVAIKDCIAIKDVPFLMGTEFFQDYTPNMDATVITRTLEAGGKILGRAVCENMCHSATSHSAVTGVVHNPYAKGYSSGGSSSGCGALVANGDVDMGIGADQGGSIRVPAGWCGLYGFKPTFGLVPFTGCGSNEPTNDHVGPMTRTLVDNAMLLQTIAGTDNIDDRGFAAPAPKNVPKYYENLTKLPNPKDLSGRKIGVIKESLDMPAMDPRIRTCFEKAVEGLKSLGAEVEVVSIPIHKDGAAIWTGISKLGGYYSKVGAMHGRRIHYMNELNAKVHPLQQVNWDKAYPATKNIYLNGAYAARAFPGLIGKATNLSRKLRDEYDAALNTYDVLVLPNLPYVANSHAAMDATPIDNIAKQVGLTSNTAPFNQSGHPVLAMPIGMLEIIEGPSAGSGMKLPVSMQVVGKWFGEEEVYRTAFAWSEAFRWKDM